MKKRFNFGYPAMDQLLPDGISVPSSTIITGPGGAGKPIIGAMLAGSWLRQGGKLIHLLINFNRAYADQLMQLFDPDFATYANSITYVEFDPTLDGMEKSSDNVIRANLLKPTVFKSVVKDAQTDANTLVYGSALNMLLFSKTYNAVIHATIEDVLGNGTNCIFTVSNSVFEKQMALLEDAADHLMLTHGTGNGQLSLCIQRMKTVSWRENDVAIPLTDEQFRDMKAEAEKARTNLIPIIKKI